jgi:PAS domain S-box-containing protein
MTLMLGRDGIMIYNDAYSGILGHRHPSAFGMSVYNVWSDRRGALIDEVLDAGLAGRTLRIRNREFTTDRSGQPEQAWFDLGCSPVRDEHGEPVGVLSVSIETTERVLAERKAARKLEALHEMFEQAPGFICMLSGPDLIVEFTNATHRRLFGVHDAVGRPYMEAFAKIAALGKPEILQEVYRTGARCVARAEPVIIPKPDGTEAEHLLDLVLEPVKDEEGNVQGLFLEGYDVTDRVRTRRAAEESNRWLRTALSIARLGGFEWDAETKVMTLDPRAREMFGFDLHETVGRDQVVARIEPDDLIRLEAESAAYKAEGRLRWEYEYRIRLPNGAVRRIASMSESSLGREGRRSRYIGVFADVTEHRAAARRQRMLINELNHRVKNTLATVQSIAAQTLRSAPSVASARGDFESRLVALAGAHDLLTAQGWRGALLEDVAARALAPFECAQQPQIRRSGPHVWLTAERALALSLALHELATNAAKYGALSAPGGHVSLRWTKCGEELTLQWIEAGGPPVGPRIREGFGARLLQRSLARELGGTVEWIFAAKGVRCVIRFEHGQAAAASPVEIAEAAATRFDF